MAKIPHSSGLILSAQHGSTQRSHGLLLPPVNLVPPFAYLAAAPAAGPRSGTARPAVRTSTGMRSPPSHHYTYASSWIHRSSKPEATIPPSIATPEPRARSSQSRCQQQRPPITPSLPPWGPSSPSIVFPSARQSKYHSITTCFVLSVLEVHCLCLKC